MFCCGKMRSTNHIFRNDLRISFSFFADSPLQRERLEFWICTLLNICQEFKWEITLNENIYFPSDSSVEMHFTRFNHFTATSYFLPYAWKSTYHQPFCLEKAWPCCHKCKAQTPGIWNMSDNVKLMPKIMSNQIKSTFLSHFQSDLKSVPPLPKARQALTPS